MKLTDKIGKYLTYADVIKAPAGIDNTPTDTYLKSIVALIEKVYDPIADHFGAKPYIHCVYRGPKYNAALKGASTNSQHMYGEAMDIDFDQVKIKANNKDIFDFVTKNLDYDQIIWEGGDATKPDWVHISYVITVDPLKPRINRKKKTRWVTKDGESAYIDFDLYKVA